MSVDGNAMCLQVNRRWYYDGRRLWELLQLSIPLTGIFFYDLVYATEVFNNVTQLPLIIIYDFTMILQ